MQRKILTFTNDLGESEDIIPYVDGYGVQIGGTNLVDYLDQIESTFERALLYLGVFANEEALLTAYPNGSDIEVGSYAIVSDTDTLYIYDTDNQEWLPTASNISGIYTLNGLSPVNGSLTITGGDINATVSSASTPTQTITSHLNELYTTDSSQNTLITTSMNNGAIYVTAVADERDATLQAYYTITVNASDYSKNLFIVNFPANYNALGTAYVVVRITDGTRTRLSSIPHPLGTSGSNGITYKEFFVRLGLSNVEEVIRNICCLLYFPISGSPQIVDFLGLPSNKIMTYRFGGSWRSRDGGGYYTDIKLEASYYMNSYQIRQRYIYADRYEVLSINKEVNSTITTAVADYSIDMQDAYRTCRIYSDETFNGMITIKYDYELDGRHTGD